MKIWSLQLFNKNSKGEENESLLCSNKPLKEQHSTIDGFKFLKKFSSVAPSNNKLSSNFKFFGKEIISKNTGVKVDTEEKDSQNNKAQLNQVLALYGFCLEDKGQGKFELKETAGISEKNWGEKVLVCVPGESPNIVRFKLKKRCTEPRFGSSPESIVPSEQKIIEKSNKKDEAQKELMQGTRFRLRKLLESSGITVDSTWEKTDWNTTRKNIEEKIKASIKTSLNASQSPLMKGF